MDALVLYYCQPSCFSFNQLVVFVVCFGTHKSIPTRTNNIKSRSNVIVMILHCGTEFFKQQQQHRYLSASTNPMKHNIMSYYCYNGGCSKQHLCLWCHVCNFKRKEEKVHGRQIYCMHHTVLHTTYYMGDELYNASIYSGREELYPVQYLAVG